MTEVAYWFGRIVISLISLVGFAMAGILFLIVLLMFLSIGVSVLERISNKRLQDKCRKLNRELEDLDFFGTLKCGVGPHSYADKGFYLDDKFGLVVMKKNRPVGVIGFHIKGRKLWVEQMQCFPRSKIGTDAGTFLLPYAEKLAEKLNLRQVFVLRAERNFYWEAAADLEDADEAIKRRQRMSKIYNVSPAAVGYESVCENDAWSRKVLC